MCLTAFKAGLLDFKNLSVCCVSVCRWQGNGSSLSEYQTLKSASKNWRKSTTPGLKLVPFLKTMRCPFNGQTKCKHARPLTFSRWQLQSLFFQVSLCLPLLLRDGKCLYGSTNYSITGNRTRVTCKNMYIYSELESHATASHPFRLLVSSLQ